MAGKVGRNSVSLANDTRPFVCEIYGGEDGVTVTNSTLFSDNADATFSLSNLNVDPTTSQLCSVEIGLAGLSDETADGDVSTSCDATVTDIETGKTKNLEPGGNYLLDVPMGQSVPSFSLDIAPGSVAVICGIFCMQINSKSLQTVISAANVIGIADVKACIAEALANLELPESDGSALFGLVDADGNVTLPDGSTAPAVDGQGNTLNPGDPVLNIFDGAGNYLGSKLCPLETVEINTCTEDGSFEPASGPVDILRPVDFIEADIFWPIGFVDSGDGCTPAEPTTKQLAVFQKFETKNPDGDTFRFDGEEWVCCSISANTVEHVCIVHDALTLLENDLVNFTTLAQADFIPAQSITNDTCTPMYVQWHIRTAFFSQLKGRWLVSADWSTDTANSQIQLKDLCVDGNAGYLAGASNDTIVGWHRRRASGLTRTLSGKLNPGDTSVFQPKLDVRTTVGDANANNIITIGTTTLRGTTWRCKD